MSDTQSLAAMRAERERLDRQINDAEAGAAADFNYRVGQLSEALRNWAEKEGIGWQDSSRKNWTTLVLDSRVSVEFGEEQDDRHGGLRVTAGGMRSEFDPLPTARELVGLVGYLVQGRSAEGPLAGPGAGKTQGPAARASGGGLLERAAQALWLADHGAWASRVPWGTSREQDLRPAYARKAAAIVAALGLTPHDQDEARETAAGHPGGTPAPAARDGNAPER